MRARNVALVASLAMALGALSSCEDPPASEMRQARIAFANLRDLAEASKWASEEFASAEASLQAAEKELASQSARLAPMRDYEKARELFATAVADAELARLAAVDGKKEAEKQARDTLDAAVTALAHVRTAMLVAHAGRSAWSRIEQDLTRHEVTLEEARNLIVAQDYIEAGAKAEKVLDEVSTALRAVMRGASR